MTETTWNFHPAPASISIRLGGPEILRIGADGTVSCCDQALASEAGRVFIQSIRAEVEAIMGATSAENEKLRRTLSDEGDIHRAIVAQMRHQLAVNEAEAARKRDDRAKETKRLKAKLAAATAEVERMRKAIDRAGKSLGGIETQMMQGDNISIVLCSHFDNPDQENDDESGWTLDAIKGCEQVLGAIRAHYAAAVAEGAP